MWARRTAQRPADGPPARWDNTPESLDPLLTEVQHALPAKVRKGKHVSAAAIIVAIMVVDWLVMTGTPLISIILAGAVVAAIALAFSASARHEDEREMRTDNFIEAVHPLLSVKGLSRNLVSVGRWKRTPLPAPAAEGSEQEGKGEGKEETGGQEEATSQSDAADNAPAPESATAASNAEDADNTDTAPQKTVKPPARLNAQKVKNLSAASWTKACRASAVVRHNLTEAGHPSNLTVHYGRTVDATNPEWVAKLLAVANRELSDGTVEFKIDSVNNTRKKLVLKAVPTAEQQAINETEAEKSERLFTEDVQKALGDTATVDFERNEDGTITQVTVHHTKSMEISMRPSLRVNTSSWLLTRLPGAFRCNWDLPNDTLTFSRRKEMPTMVTLPAHAQPLRQRADKMESYEAYSKFKIMLGLTEDGEWVTWHPKSDPHLLIVGGTGSGKTISLHNIIQQITQAGYRVWLCDGKQFELMGYESWPNVELIADTVPSQIRAIKLLHDIMHERNDKRRVRAAKNGGKRYRVIDYDPIFFIGDELAQLKANITDFYNSHKVKGMPAKSEVDKWLGSIARLSRSSMIHMVSGLQQGNAEIMGGETRENYGARMTLGQISKESSMMMWSDASVGCAVPPVKGRALAFHNGRPTMIQTVFAPNPDPEHPDYDADKLKQVIPQHQLYTMKYVKELEEKTQIHNEKTDEFEEALTPWDDYLEAPILAEDDEPIDVEFIRTEALEIELKHLEAQAQEKNEPEPVTLTMPVVTPEVVMEPEVSHQEPGGNAFDETIWEEEHHGVAETLQESDLVKIDGEWVVVTSLLKNPFGSGGESILGYRTIYGESGSLTMSPNQTLNIRRARSEEEIEARTREEE